MVEVDDEEFEQIVGEAMDALPEKYAKKLNNVAFVVEDEPTPAQMAKLHLVNGQILFGLYEGIPQTARTNNYNLVLPDKITIFKKPIQQVCTSLEHLKEQVRYTVWHEVAHHFGLGHDQIHKLDDSG
jgi:predicted Zn-dependent protease with MMP-like domain